MPRHKTNYTKILDPYFIDFFALASEEDGAIAEPFDSRRCYLENSTELK